MTIPDLFHSTLKYISHNRYLALGAAALIGVTTYGCVQPTTLSPFSDKSVTAAELSKEFNAKIDTYESDFAANLREIDARIAANDALARKAQIAKQDTDALFTQLEKARQDRLALVNTISEIATPLLGPTIAPVVTQLLPFGIGALGLGALADNRRKDRKILALQNSSGAPNV